MNTKCMLTVASAGMTLLLSGCGEGGSGGPVSTPAPPASYKTLDELTGNQTFQTAGIHWQATSSGLSGQAADAFGSGLVISYNDGAGTFTLTAPDGTTGTFTAADEVVSARTATSHTFQKTIPGGGQQLTLGRPLVGGVQLSYLEIGQFISGGPSGSSIWTAVGGVPTIASDMPKTGTATYNAAIGAAVINSTGVNTLDPSSSATFSANFGAGSVATTVHLIGAASSPGGAVDYGTFNGTGTISASGPGFAGSFAGTTGPGFSGAFFGPQGAEMGYAFNFKSAGNDAYGAVYGRKN